MSSGPWRWFSRQQNTPVLPYPLPPLRPIDRGRLLPGFGGIIRRPGFWGWAKFIIEKGPGDRRGELLRDLPVHY
jgi:hypothetical protein